MFSQADFGVALLLFLVSATFTLFAFVKCQRIRLRDRRMKAVMKYHSEMFNECLLLIVNPGITARELWLYLPLFRFADEYISRSNSERLPLISFTFFLHRAIRYRQREEGLCLPKR